MKDRSDGRIQIAPKHQMKNAGLDSPDFADALALASQGEMVQSEPPRFTNSDFHERQWKSMTPAAVIRRRIKAKSAWRGIKAL